jgi:hypothetical protein
VSDPGLDREDQHILQEGAEITEGSLIPVSSPPFIRLSRQSRVTPVLAIGAIYEGAGCDRSRQTDSRLEVCPHNSPKFVQITSEEAFWPREGVHGVALIELMRMDQAEVSRRFWQTLVKRAERLGLLNVAVGLGNWGSPEAVPVLTIAVTDEEHLAWALVGSEPELRAGR